MSTAFKYRARSAREFVDASPGSVITLDEQTDYILVFADDCSTLLVERIASIGGDMVRPDTAVLNFRNFVGRVDLAGVAIDVRSTKIGEEGVSRLLQEVSELGSVLVFGSHGKTGFAAAPQESHRPPVPYHQFQFLRRAMLSRRTGERVQDWLEAVERSPTRQFEPDRPILSPHRVRRIDQRAIASVFARIDRLVPVPSGAPIDSSPLAKALTFGDPPRRHFPDRIAAPRGRLSFDTFENRFVKHVLGECLALVHRFVDHPRLHAALKRDCRTMLSTLTTLSDAPFLAEVGRLTRFRAPSQALAKAEGYRELFSFWMDLTRRISLPLHPSQATQFLDGRDIASLYEYWTFVKLVEAVTTVSGASPSAPATIQRDEFGETLVLGLRLNVGTEVIIRFNPTFTRSRGTAYSTPLRPDVIIETPGGLHAFDAKYRLNRLDIEDGDTDDDEILTYKRADLYKMHTYRDAITNLRTAFAVYPGSEFVFFERAGTRRMEAESLSELDGVGAIPMRPTAGDPASALRAVVSHLLGTAQAPAA